MNHKRKNNVNFPWNSVKQKKYKYSSYQTNKKCRLWIIVYDPLLGNTDQTQGQYYKSWDYAMRQPTYPGMATGNYFICMQNAYVSCHKVTKICVFTIANPLLIIHKIRSIKNLISQLNYRVSITELSSVYQLI